MTFRVATVLVTLILSMAWMAPASAADKAPRKKAKPAAKKAADTDSESSSDKSSSSDSAAADKDDAPGKLETATFGQGCFWCAEAVFQQIKGVKSIVSGYSGGEVPNPTYEMVGTGLTGHAEVVEITFDPKVVSYEELLDVFWHSHDPTQLNAQGPDHGTQYRSIILYHNEQQKETAEKSKAAQMKSGHFKRKIVTEIAEFTKFYAAEDYHQNYFKSHPENPYCYELIRPKVNKVKKLFKNKVSKDGK